MNGPKRERKLIIWTGRKLSKTERKNFKRENPGERLCFRLRYPNFPLFVLSVGIGSALIIKIIQGMLL